MKKTKIHDSTILKDDAYIKIMEKGEVNGNYLRKGQSRYVGPLILQCFFLIFPVQ